ncbi:epidermal retinol dehydrogenase 2 [Lepeophtheirus salmonis]|uniref:epidermal retinol dehydrogenase 2 n=1 Tax=Lepeophtheirus salmonis TaxID=72036 RepID=UPI001AE1FD34|nr:epidermal retinol dehydrogenase 2-like [Lepeophtheirus salmonis]XP_040564287.1 epidermal retinol dehydrogenase 2-like [Lepeophtheirus salmonis]XP_040564288.1 epidermal retinol dehydrogenase 2-like [Lepeophtheirus salmonis]XP_040564289.1 epidermal retinol dehydrogenase 2-like [Lepeophtheirus salmonis]XP_040564290.1 epidermal retinol dehydrogenase 2-like [Lepeophtheirus salmonis]
MLLLIIEILRSLIIALFYYIPLWIKLLLPQYFKKSVKKDIVLITGGASGFGKSLAIKLLKLGANVIIIDVNKKAGDQTLVELEKIISTLPDQLRGFIKFYSCDLTKKDNLYTTLNQIKQNEGDIDILVNNAGVISGSSLLDTPDEKIQLTFDVNIMAHFWTIKSILPSMIRRRKGHIVNVASMAGLVGTNNLVDYCASKFAAVGLHEAMRGELFANGNDFIKCSLICPYFASTGMFAGVSTGILPMLNPEEVTDKILDAILLERDSTCLPWYAGYIPLLKILLPSKVFIQFTKRIGISSSMDHFKGRENSNKKMN